jgi:hypothetical protein
MVATGDWTGLRFWCQILAEMPIRNRRQATIRKVA